MLGWRGAGVCEVSYFFFFQAEDGIRDYKVTGVQTCALPISADRHRQDRRRGKRLRSGSPGLHPQADQLGTRLGEAGTAAPPVIPAVVSGNGDRKSVV